MEIVKILGCDPSTRHTGLAVVQYNCESGAFLVERCQTISTPQKYKGKDAILCMLDMIKEESKHYEDVDTVIIESPVMLFGKCNNSSIISIAHVSGGAAALLGLEKTYFFRPSEWNRCRKKEVTHKKMMEWLGDPAENWNFKKNVKSDSKLEHILDAASMALFFIRHEYIEENDE